MQTRSRILVASTVLLFASLIWWKAEARNFLQRLWTPTTATSHSPYLDELVTRAQAQPNTDIVSFLKALPEDWRKKYTLVYRSRSLQAASLEKPRVIATDPNYRITYSFGDIPDRQGNRTIEAIETFGREPARFLRLTFPAVAGAPITIERNPQICSNCHALSRGATAENGFIWEPYPHWPGVFGGFDNDRMYGNTPYGSALLPRPEFETQALDQFVKADLSGTVYDALVDRGAVTYAKLSNFNTFLGESLIGHHFLRTEEKITETAPDFFEFQSYAFAARFNSGDAWNQKGAPGMTESNPYHGAWSSDAYYNRPLSTELETRVMNESDARLNDLRSIYAQYGTAADQQIIQQAKVFLPRGGEYLYRKGQHPVPYAFVGHQLVHLPPSFSNLMTLFFLQTWQKKNPSVSWAIGADRARTLSSLNTGTIEGAFFSGEEGATFLKRARNPEELVAFLPLAFKKYESASFEQNPGMALLRMTWENEILDAAKKFPSAEVAAALSQAGVRGLSAEFDRRLRAQ